MAIDSAAELLFKIGANTDEAEGNVQRFRSLLGKDLAGLSAEFDEWSGKVFGDLNTVKGAMIGLTSAFAAGIVAAAGAALEASHKYSEFVDEVERGSRVTGLSAENMSRLKFAADVTHVSYDALVTGLTRFASTIVKANEGSEQQAQAFARLGISQGQLKAGEKDMLPLLEAVADRFSKLGSQVDRTAMARELFSRGGPALVAMLSQGSAGMREMFEEAEKLGLVIGTADVQANEEYKQSIHLLKSEMEGIAITIGRMVLPQLSAAAAHILGFIEAYKEMSRAPLEATDILTFEFAHWARTLRVAGERADQYKEQIDSLAASLSKFGDTQGEDLLPPLEKEKEEWSGLADVLQRVKDHAEDQANVVAHAYVEWERLQTEVQKATEKYQQLLKAGKLTAEDAKAQAAALAQLPAAMTAALGVLLNNVSETTSEASQDLQRRILGQQQQTMAVKVSLWDQEMAGLREKLLKEGKLTAENWTLLEHLQQAGWDKISIDAAEGVREQGEQLDRMLEAQGEKTLAQKHADLDRELTDRAKAMIKAEDQQVADWEELSAIAKAGHAKIDAEAKSADDTELARLQEQLARIEGTHQTSAQRIAADYQADLASVIK